MRTVCGGKMGNMNVLLQGNLKRRGHWKDLGLDNGIILQMQLRCFGSEDADFSDKVLKFWVSDKAGNFLYLRIF